MRGHLYSALATSLLFTACSGEPSDVSRPAPDSNGIERAARSVVTFTHTEPDALNYEQKAQSVDIADIGNDRVVVGFVSHATGTRQMTYLYYNVATGQVEMPAAPQGSMQGLNVRANKSRFQSESRWCANPGVFGVYMRNFFAIELDGQIYLDRHSFCAGVWQDLTWEHVDSGELPTVATSGTFSGGRALVAYQQATATGAQIKGRIYEFSTASWRPSFVIAELPPSAALSLDLLYNSHSNKFILHYVQKGSNCSIRNVTLTNSSTPVVGTIMSHGACDTENGGHFMTSSYSQNATGHYLWWRQGPSAEKGLFLHKSDGTYADQVWRTDNNSGLLSTAYTVPVYPKSAGEHVTKTSVFFQRSTQAGTWEPFDQASGTIIVPVAIRALSSHTIVAELWPTGNGTQSMWLRVSDFP
jgi:hypothetical protein